MFYLGKISKPSEFLLVDRKEEPIITSPEYAEKLDHSKLFAYLLGVVMLGIACYKAIVIPDRLNLNFINPNFINFLLLALGILCHGNFYKFLKAVNHAIVGTSGILIQFPIYFGIMSLMKESGMINQLSDFFVSISTEHSFPIYTLFSAGIVNIFVPSGGGQWAIQGPIIIEASTTMGLNLSKNIMALAYGDQLTNMLQPFWALPLLGITGLKAKEILPYTVMLMLVGASVFILGLMIW
jgi:short-chain fatty acids transporter